MRSMRPLSLFALFLLTVLCLLSPSRAAEFLVAPHQNVILFGDSITANGEYGQLMQEMIDQRYPERQIRVLARGAAGDTVQRAMGRIEEDVVAWRPGLVLINFGINDYGRFSTEDYLMHYENMINRILRDTGARVGIVSPVYLDRDGAELPQLRDYVQGLQALARKYDLLYAPVYETTKRLRAALPKGVMYATDGVHPDRLGYWMFAQTILSALNYPLPKVPLALEIPARRVTADQSDKLTGTTFTVSLPMPLQVTLTNPPLREVTISRASKPVVLDGKLDEWELGKPMLLQGADCLVLGVMSWKRDHYTARAFASYDENALYFAVQVYDSVVINPVKPRHVVSRDCLEVALDLRTAEEKATEPWVTFFPTKPHIAQYILAPASDEVPAASVEMGNGDKSMLEGVKVASTLTNFGYQLEFSVPAARFPGGVITPSSRIGFDISAVNVDRHANYVEAQELRYTGSPWSAFTTREFGCMMLGN